MRKLSVVCLVVLLVAGLSGCPPGNINPSGLNSVTLHNSGETDILFLSVTRIEATKAGINLLAEPLAPGETFRVDGLEDGQYEFYVRYVDPPFAWRHSTMRQYLEGGVNYDWYFNDNV